MNTLPAFPAAEGRFATVDSGGLHCPPEKSLNPVHVLLPASVAKPLVLAVGCFHEFVALQNHKFWFVVSMYTTGGVQLPLGAPDPAVMAVVPVPLIWVQTPGAPVTVQKYRFCPAAASVAKYICPCVQAVGRDTEVPALAGAVLPAPLKSTTETLPLAVSVPL
jgi:hypothetical protein